MKLLQMLPNCYDLKIQLLRLIQEVGVCDLNQPDFLWGYSHIHLANSHILIIAHNSELISFVSIEKLLQL